MSESAKSSDSPRNRVANEHGYSLAPVPILPVGSFDCGDDDLNEYFAEDAVEARRLLVAETFGLRHEEMPEGFYAALVSVCNDVISLRGQGNTFKEHLGKADTPATKLYAEWPAVKIARLGVRNDLQGVGLGSYTIKLLTRLFVTENRTGCRVITVDAYNKPEVTSFYQRTGFVYLTEKDANKQTRAMWCDLLPMRPPLSGTPK